jgi:PAS domain S-box-containing protein
MIHDQKNTSIKYAKLLIQLIINPSTHIVNEIERQRITIFNTFLVLVIVVQSIYLFFRIFLGFLSESKQINENLDIFLNIFLLICFIFILGINKTKFYKYGLFSALIVPLLSTYLNLDKYESSITFEFEHYFLNPTDYLVLILIFSALILSYKQYIGLFLFGTINMLIFYSIIAFPNDRLFFKVLMVLIVGIFSSFGIYIRDNFSSKLNEEKIETEKANILKTEFSNKYRWIFNNAGDGIIVFEINPETYEESIINVNHVLIQQLGYTEKELQKLTIKDFSRPNKEIKDILRELVKKESNFITSTHKSKEGKEIEVEIRSTIYKENEKVYAISIVRDISERSKNLLAIKKFSGIVEQTFNSVIMIDKKVIIEYVNQSFLLLLGHNENDILGKNFDNTLTNESKIRYNKIMQGILNLESSWKGEFQHIKFDGSIYWTSTSVAKLVDENGNLLNYFIIEDDITAIKELTIVLEKKSLVLYEEKLKIESILNNIPFGVVVVQENREILFLNNSFSNFILNEFNFEFKIGERTNSLEQMNFLEKAITDIKVNKNYSKIINFKSDKHWELTITLIETETLKTIFIIVLRDITEFVEFKLLQKQFISTISHELRTPITSIHLSINNYKNYYEKLNDVQKINLLNIINQSSTILKNMTEDLLILSKIDSKNLTFRTWEKINIREQLQNLILQFNSQLQAKNLTISSIEKGTPFIYGDIDRFNQLIRIIFENAIKYSYKNNKIIISFEENYNGEYNPNNLPGCLLCFQDFGPGIPSKEQKFLGKRFFRGSNVIAIEGTGIGLSILLEILSLFKGEYFINSSEAQGTEFILFLPLITEKNTNIGKS